MMKKRVFAALFLLTLAMLALLLVPPLFAGENPVQLPGAAVADRQLLRVWVLGVPGGGMRWLRGCIRTFEKAASGVSVYVRQNAPLEDVREYPPDVLLFLPGELTTPEGILLPLATKIEAEEPLLRSGRWQGTSYALPVAWGAWALCINRQWDSTPSTGAPVPTAFLGYPSATASPDKTLPYPREGMLRSPIPLAAPKGVGLVSLGLLLPQESRPPLGDAFPMDSVAAYQAFAAGRAGSALLTTGQITALEALQQLGRGVPFRVMVPDIIVTDQVWMAGLCRESPMGAAFLQHLASDGCQQALNAQGLHAVRRDVPGGAGHTALAVDESARRGFIAMNAFLPRETAAQTAWQLFQGILSLPEGLPLLQ